jgi:TolA-binding protein
MMRNSLKDWLIVLAAASTFGASAAWAQEAEESAEETAAETDVESDTDLDKDAAESGEDITGGEEMKAEDENRIFKQEMAPPKGASKAFETELRSFQSSFARYADEIQDYQTTVDAIVDAEYARKVATINEFYDSKINANETIERQYRTDAIAAFENFLERHPNEERYTPDAMFRLAELYFEKANDDFLLADEQYQEKLDAYEAGKIPDPPADPQRDYSKTIATFQRLIDDWPDYRLLDGAYYLVAYCELQMGNDEKARDLFAQLIVERPDSEFVPEAWIRIGEYHFAFNELDLARGAYEQAMSFPDSKYFDKALYKLAWTHYRQDDFDEAIKQFKRLVEYSDEIARKTGESGSVLREESIQYIAISLSEEDWDLDGNKDPDFGMTRFQRYVSGDEPYEREVLMQLGEYLFDNTRFATAVDVYNFLLKKYPLDRRNPEVHEQIILALLRDDNVDAAFRERSKLSQYYGEGSDWYAYQQKLGNAEATRYAQNLVKDNLIQSATWYHAEAQKVRNRAEVEQDEALMADARDKYEVAAQGYADFLKKYPNDKDIYQWNFYYAECLYYSAQYEPAYEQYRVVREMDVSNNEYQEVAAFNAVKSLEFRLTSLIERGEVPAKVLPTDAMEEARSAAEEQETARENVDERSDQKVAVKEETIPELVQRYITAMDRYVVLGLKNEEDKHLDAKFAFSSAKVFYDFKHYDTARRRLDWIVNNYPDNEVAYLAGSLILETYRKENDFAGLASAAERLGNVIKGEQAQAIKEEVKTLQLGALFKEAEKLFAEKQYERAAEKYVQLIQENPDTEYAAKALNNAAVAYENVQRYESAMKLYERVYKEHPDDPLATYALYRMGVNQERFFDFDNAIQTYELFYDKAGQRTQDEIDQTGLKLDLEEKQADALLNAAILQENLQNYTAAGRGYERFVRTFPDDDKSPDAAWQASIVWEKANNKSKMVDAIENFVRDYGAEPKYDERVMEGLAKIADYHESRNDKRRADRQYEEIIDEYMRRGIQPGSKPSFYAAKAEFMLVEREYEDWEDIKIRGNLNRQKRLLKKKIEGQKALTPKYEKVYEYRNLEWTLAATFRIGKMHQDFANALYEVPIPFKEGSEQYDIYRTQLEDIAIPLEDEAIKRYEGTIAKAREEKIVNEWTKKALEQLNQYKPGEYPLYHEERRELTRRRTTGRNYLDFESWRNEFSPPEETQEGDQ